MDQDFKIDTREGKHRLIKYHGNDQEVFIPEGIEIIGSEAFTGNKLITSVSLPEGLEEIGANAFSHCVRLGSIVLPKSIQEVSRDAFDNCSPTFEICLHYFHAIGKRGQVQGIDGKYFTLLDLDGEKIGKIYQLSPGVFNDFINKLTSGGVKHLSEYDKLFFSTSDLMSRMCKAAMCRLEYPLELDDKFREMYINFLQNNSAYILPSLIKSEDVGSISLLTMISAIPQESLDLSLREASKNNLTEITAILLDYKNKRWGASAFSDSALDINSPPKEWVTQVNVDGELTISRYVGDKENVRIPSMVEGQRVQRICRQLGSLKVSIFFPYLDKVRSVELEEGIEVIDERAFLDCHSLTNVVIPGSVKEIAAEAFCGCTELQLINIPTSVKEIGGGVLQPG